MEDIKQKLEILNYQSELNTRVNKHAVSLIMSSLEDIQKIVTILLEKGIIELNKDRILVEPQNFTIFTNGYEYVKKTIEEYEQSGELEALKEDLSRINSKGAIKRIESLKKLDEPYKTPDGKYSNTPFKLSKYSFKYEDEHNEEDHSYDNILTKPQTMGLDSESYFRYEELYDHAKNIMVSLYGIDEVDSNIVDNMIKLITNGVDDDKVVLFYAITYDKDLTEEEKHRISDAVYDELDYTNILNLNLGRAA